MKGTSAGRDKHMEGQTQGGDIHTKRRKHTRRGERTERDIHREGIYTRWIVYKADCTSTYHIFGGDIHTKGHPYEGNIHTVEFTHGRVYTHTHGENIHTVGCIHSTRLKGIVSDQSTQQPTDSGQHKAIEVEQPSLRATVTQSNQATATVT